MRRRSHFPLAIAALAVVAFAGCDALVRGDNPSRYPFAWAQGGTTLTYDFRPVADTLTLYDGTTFSDTDGALVLAFDPTSDESSFSVRASYPEWNSSHPGVPSALGVAQLLPGAVLRESEGLALSVFGTCDEGIPIVGFFTGRKEIRVPAEASPGDEVTVYQCADEVEEVLEVESVSAPVHALGATLPAMVLRGRRHREYWSEERGLLRLEVLTVEGEVLGYYSLTSVGR